MVRHTRVGVLVIGFLVPVIAACTTPVNAAWSQLPPADLSTHDVDCAAPTSCWQISYEALAHWDGGSWTAVPIATPPGQRWIFRAISCPGATTCFLGGSRFDSTGSLPLLLRWDGATATEVPVAVAEMTEVDNLSCSTETSCLLRLQAGPNGVNGAIVVWNGTSMLATTLPADVSLDMGNFGISCGAPTNCAVVASRSGGGYGLLHWNGSWWAFTPAVSTAGGNAVADDVACAGPTFCAATGRDSIGPIKAPLRVTAIVATRSAVGWTVFSPVGPAARGTFHSALAVSCSSQRWCLAEDGGGTEGQRSLVWGGQGWGVAPPQPAGGPYAVTCAESESWCLAFGNDSYLALAPTSP